MTDRGVFGSGLRFLGEQPEIGSIDSVGSVLRGDEPGYTLELWVQIDRVHLSRIASMLRVRDEQHPGITRLCALETMGDAQSLGSSTGEEVNAKPGSLRFYQRSPIDTQTAAGVNLWPAKPYAVGQWALLTAVRSEQQITLYLDGKAIAQSDCEREIAWPVTMRVGSFLTDDPSIEDRRPFSGIVDEVAVYPYALDAERIESRYRLGLEALQARGELVTNASLSAAMQTLNTAQPTVPLMAEPIPGEVRTTVDP